MGRIDWSRYKKSKNAQPSPNLVSDSNAGNPGKKDPVKVRPMFSGGHKSYVTYFSRMKNRKQSFKVVISGGVASIDNRRFVISLGKRFPNDVLVACQMVKRQALKYLEQNGEPEYGESVNCGYNASMATSFIEAGGRDVVNIDISHCYWQLMRRYGIIDQALYEKFIDNRQARLVAVGNLGKLQQVQVFIDGDLKYRYMEPPPTECIWKFIQFQSHRIMQAIISSGRQDVFAFFTDGIYITAGSCDRVRFMLDSLNILYSVKEFTITGHNKHYIILENKADGTRRRTHFGVKASVLSKMLPFIEM